MSRLKKYIIALLVGITFITNACAQGEKVVSLKFYPKDSIEDIIDNHNSSEKTRMDSLTIIDAKMDSIFAFITKSISEKTIWTHFYIVVAKIDKSIFVEILADFSNEQLFKNRGKYYGYDIYGSLDYNKRKMYVVTQNMKNEEMKHYFKKDGKYIYISKEDADALLVSSKYENPMWLYEFKEKNLVLVKSANVEYLYKADTTKRK
jgi:hypothetical protein